MPTAAKNGEHYIPVEERTGGTSVVFFTRDLSPAGLRRAYEAVHEVIKPGKVAVKLHTGEPNGPNIIPPAWVRELLESEPELADARIIETNTFYDGARYNTEDHRKTLEVNGWTEFCDVDIVDDKDAYAYLPVKDGNWFEKMSVGKGMLDYESFVALTHFKGHAMGGFGGSNKNIGIGCASGHEGKMWIHQKEGSDDQWSIATEELMERMTECTKAVINHFADKICFVNVMRNMSVSCDCEGTAAAPVVTPNVGILASLDICALDTACVDIVYAMSEEEHHDLVERIETRHGHRQLSYMHELGMGNMLYKLIDLDNGNAEITPADCVVDLEPFSA